MFIALSANSCWYLYNFRKNTIRTLIAEGNKVICIAPEDQSTSKLIELGCIHQPTFLSANGINPLSELKTLYQLHALLRSLRPDVILTFNPKLNLYGGIAAKALKIRHIANISGLGTLNDLGLVLRTLSLFCYRIALSSSKHVFFQNDRDKDLLCKLKIVNPSKTSRLMGSGVDLQQFHFREMPPAHQTRFVFIGRLIEQKGVRRYVEAARILQEKYGSAVRFSIIGILENPTSKRAITKIELDTWEKIHNIQFRGTSDNVASDVAEDHAVVIPTTYSEGVPKVALESASVGRIVIISDLPGCRDTVEDGVTGFLCAPTQTNSIVEAMEQTANLDAESKIRMGRGARLRMQKLFDEKHNIEAYLAQIRRTER